MRLFLAACLAVPLLGGPALAAPLAHFKTATLAAHSCPGDTVVWATGGKSKLYHKAGDRYYGKTRHGSFVCEKAADSAGLHAARMAAVRKKK